MCSCAGGVQRKQEPHLGCGEKQGDLAPPLLRRLRKITTEVFRNFRPERALSGPPEAPRKHTEVPKNFRFSSIFAVFGLQGPSAGPRSARKLPGTKLRSRRKKPELPRTARIKKSTKKPTKTLKSVGIREPLVTPREPPRTSGSPRRHSLPFRPTRTQTSNFMIFCRRPLEAESYEKR